MSVAVAQAMRYAGCPNRRSLGVSDVFPFALIPYAFTAKGGESPSKPAECAAKQRLTRRWGMMAWRVRAAIIEDRMWALGGSRSPKRARHANWERAQCRQSEHFCGRGRGASSAGRSDYYQF